MGGFVGRGVEFSRKLDEIISLMVNRYEEFLRLRYIWANPLYFQLLKTIFFFYSFIGNTVNLQKKIKLI